MLGFDPKKSFLGKVAEHNDDLPRGDESETVELLAEMSQGEPTLELAVGSGRIALPLAARGITVDGIELSDDMIDILRRRPGGDKIDVVTGDMITATTGKTYRLVVLVFNSIFNLLTQDDQVRCFANAARHLTSDGMFLIEAAVPSAWIRGNQYVNAERVEIDEVVLDVCRYDPVTQLLDESHVRLNSGGVQLRPISCRLAWPAELDLMARLAGLCLRERWAGWQREPFTAASDRHVSVYVPA
jgi:SAM-dependent methyltransferase